MRFSENLPVEITYQNKVALLKGDAIWIHWRIQFFIWIQNEATEIDIFFIWIQNEATTPGASNDIFFIGIQNEATTPGASNDIFLIWIQNEAPSCLFLDPNYFFVN